MPELTPETIKRIVLEAVREALESRPSAWPRWLPIKEAARYSGLSEKTLRRLAKDGEIYAVESPGGGKLLFDRESIDEYFLREKARLKAHLDLIRDRKVW